MTLIPMPWRPTPRIRTLKLGWLDGTRTLVPGSPLAVTAYSILAASIDRMPKAYEQYLRTSRLDLDDYNHEVHEGLHITSMAGTWMAIVEGFGGMRVWENEKLTFNPQIPSEWKSYSFKINFRGSTLKVEKTQNDCKFTNESNKDVVMSIGKEEHLVPANESVMIVGSKG